MAWSRRVRTVYIKELVDILRDRRTLIALLLVPIVLYPLLMLGAIQALSVQTQKLSEETVVIGVTSESQAFWLRRLMKLDEGIYAAHSPEDAEAPDAAEEREPASQQDADNAPDDLEQLGGIPMDPPLKDVRFVMGQDLVGAVKLREIQVGVTLSEDDDPPFVRQLRALVRYDPEEIRSAVAGRRLIATLDRVGAHIREERMHEADIPLKALSPVVVERQAVTTPGSLLGQILPLILVLMTITGAIYPAIDLTAGERERGTLETLMVCPVPVFDLIAGKFLVVTTVALIGATLNLASVSATVYFGGFEQVVTGGGQAEFPLVRLPLILLSLLPFAVLFSATLIAVCSYARTFKEAQNYVTPVILAALIPGGIAAVATPRLEGTALVMPVANMVLLTRELLIGTQVTLGQAAVVLLSTSLYAAAAVGVAARIFGQEAVVFADSGSLKHSLDRRHFKPRELPSITLVMFVAALLFPAWFYVQAAAQPDTASEFVALLTRTAALLPVFFILLPWAVLAWWKVSRVRTLKLHAPPHRFMVAAILLGLSLWAPGHELSLLVQRVISVPEGLAEAERLLLEALKVMPAGLAVLALGIVPGVCEELFFRGFLLSGLSTTLRKWVAIIVTACIFGAFHFIALRFPVTVLLGVVLGYLCWQAGSIWPSVVAHALHNSVVVLPVIWPAWHTLLRIEAGESSSHLPMHVLGGAVVLMAAAFWLARRPAESDTQRSSRLLAS